MLYVVTTTQIWNSIQKIKLCNIHCSKHMARPMLALRKVDTNLENMHILFLNWWLISTYFLNKTYQHVVQYHNHIFS